MVRRKVRTTTNDSYEAMSSGAPMVDAGELDEDGLWPVRYLSDADDKPASLKLTREVSIISSGL